jgi:hypothetical protein
MLCCCSTCTVCAEFFPQGAEKMTYRTVVLTHALTLSLFVLSVLLGSCQRADYQTNRIIQRETGRCFLTGKRNEDCGYGLYSYLLLGSVPSDANRERYVKAIAAFLRLTPDIKDLERSNIPVRALNIAYIPLVDVEEQSPIFEATYQAKGDSPLMDDLAKWVLTNYNYARARAFLNSVPGGPHLDGPYFVSTLKPLTGIEAISEQYLYQDLSSVPPDIIAPWIKEFIAQAGQEQFWEGRNAAQFALKLRKSIALLAMGASQSKNAWPKAKEDLESLIEWKK